VSDNPVHAKRRNRYKLHQQHFYFNPESNFTLYEDDILVLLGRQLSLEHLQDLIETSRLKGKKLWTMN
ncbi:MAG: potassium channel protein, partial [Methyloprofundus sp.]|nr:potassium channel protein [Methyloprofundus sp.]